MSRRFSSQIDRYSVYLKRNVFNYKYLGRNLKVGVIALCVGVIGTVIGIGGMQVGSKIAVVSESKEVMDGSTSKDTQAVTSLETYATVNASHLMAYEKPDDNSVVLDILAEGNSYIVVEQNGDWVAVTLLSGATGYIPANQVTISEAIVSE